MVGGTILYALTSILGYKTWKVRLPGGGSPGPLLAICLYTGCFGVALPVTLRNIYRSYRDGTGKMRPLLEMIRPMVSICICKHLQIYVYLLIYIGTYCKKTVLKINCK